MTKKALAVLVLALAIAGAASGKIMFDQGSYSGIAYSPRDFTAAYHAYTTLEAFSSGEAITLSGGNTARYTTAEIVSVTVFRGSNEAYVFVPTQNEFKYIAPTLEVEGAFFQPGDEFRVAVIDSDTMIHWAMVNKTLASTSTAYPMTFEAGMVVAFDLNARGGDIKWMEDSATIEGEFVTIRQDGTLWNQVPVRIPMNTIWWFVPKTAGATLEVIYGYF